MRIEQDMKLDYKDVLIRPKRSTLGSRKDVDLERGYTFRNYKPEFPDNIEHRHWRGTPVMAANMDGVGTFEMADVLATAGIFTCLVAELSESILVFCANAHKEKMLTKMAAPSCFIIIK